MVANVHHLPLPQPATDCPQPWRPRVLAALATMNASRLPAALP